MQNNELETYFTSIKEDFNGVYERFDVVNGRLDRIEERLDGIDVKLDNIEISIRRVENLCFLILEVVRGQDVKFKEFDQRLMRLEHRTV